MRFLEEHMSLDQYFTSIQYILENKAILVASCNNCKALLPTDRIILFCPECGVTRINAEQNMTRKSNQNISRVKMKWQLLFAIIPLITFVAAYKIKKLKETSIIYSISAVVTFFTVAVLENTLPYGFLQDFLSNFIEYEYVIPVELFVIFGLIPSLVMVYFIIRWSRQWNKLISFLESQLL